MDIKKIKTAIVGCGDICDTYLSSLKNKFQIIDVIACSDRNEHKMKEKAEKYGIVAMRYEEILKDEDIELIINLTTPVSHYQIIKEALEAGKHVYSEKMLAVDLKDGEELCKIAKEKNLRLAVAPDTFLGGSIQTAKYIVDNNLIGQPISAIVSVNRDFNINGQFLPHLYKKGGNIAFDFGCYFMTALACILGPARKITSFAKIYDAHRIGNIPTTINFGKNIEVADYNIVTAIVEYENDVLCTVHLNSESIVSERPFLEIYGTDGILVMGNPDRFDGKNYIKKPKGDLIEFPFTHGYTDNSRGVGVAEMAWSIVKNRPHRTSMEMAYHVFEQIHGMHISAQTSEVYNLTSTFEIPAPLKTGCFNSGKWTSIEETSIIN